MTIRSPIPGWEQLVELRRAQEGLVAVMVALLISALIGVAGLATETGMWYALKRQNQTAADAAALTEYAGQVVTGVTTTPSAAATSTAASNQFSTSAPNTVAVNSPVCNVGNAKMHRSGCLDGSAEHNFRAGFFCPPQSISSPRPLPRIKH